MKFIGYGQQWIDEEDIKQVTEVLRSSYLTQGPKIPEFEKSICDYTGSKYCIAVSNGTAALHLAVLATGIKNGDEGITTPNTFAASANCIVYCGGKPVFADIDSRSYNLNPNEVNRKLTGKTKLVIPVHFAGQPANVKEIYKIVKQSEQKIYIIEDAAHAIGSRFENGTKVGNSKYADMTTFSFHPVKTITTGEGGAITTNNETIYQKLLLLRNHGITRDKLFDNTKQSPWYYEMQTLGYNYRLTDIQAVLGLSQMKKLDKFINRRREIISQYNKAFENFDWIICPYENKELFSAFHLYVLQVDFIKLGKSRMEVMNELKNRGIGTQVHYIPVHTQPYYKNKFNYKWGDFPVTEAYYERALSIPLFPKMTDEDVRYVIDNIIKLSR